jgi:hypothetical protein
MHELKMWEGGYFFLEDAIDKVRPPHIVTSLE